MDKPEGTTTARLIANGGAVPTPGLDALLPMVDRSSAMELHKRRKRQQAQEREA